jgi:serine/threonine protein kinase
VEHVMNEKKVLERIDHPFIVHLAATFQTQNEIFMLLELALGGELFSLLQVPSPSPST